MIYLNKIRATPAVETWVSAQTGVIGPHVGALELPLLVGVGRIFLFI